MASSQIMAVVVVLILSLGLLGRASAKKNVLFLVSDDMRPNLNKAYGISFMHTPNLDKLAASGMVFDRHYTNFAICSASRNSFMTGRMPDKTQVWNFINNFRQSRYWQNKTAVTLPEYFKQHGYLTLGAGKLYHPNHPPKNDEPYSWSQDKPYILPYVGDQYNKECFGKDKSNRSLVCVEPNLENETDAPFLDGIRFADYYEANGTIYNLQYAAKEYSFKNRNFFIGLGVTKPHATWNVPQYFYNLYRMKDTPNAMHTESPKGVPDMAYTAELDGQRDMSVFGSQVIPGSQGPLTVPLPSPGNNTVPVWFNKIVRWGYYAAVSLADQHLGMVLDELENLHLVEDTLVVFTADHGYQLGEHGEFAKHTNFELATHVPLIIRAPWIPSSVGVHTSSFTELVDLYRTIASLAGLPEPDADVDGKDVSSLLTNPKAQVNTASFSQYSRCPGDRYWPNITKGMPAWFMNNCEEVPAQNITSMGYSIRSKGYRYTEWLKWNGETCAAEWSMGPVYGRELYVHNDDETYPLDFDCCENENIANDTNPMITKVIQELRGRLHEHYHTNAPAPRGCPQDS